MRGRIIKILSDNYLVRVLDKDYLCKTRGIFRNKKISFLVGDYVIVDQDKLLITELLDRKNSLFRPKVSNVDIAFVLVSLKDPDLDLILLDKMLAILEINRIKSVIVLSKEDLVKEEDRGSIKKIFEYYKSIGYTVLYNYELELITSFFKNNTCVFMGQTGSGKSSLLNRIDPSLELKTDEISYALGRGKHTTREASLVELNGGYVIDTAGFSKIDLDSFSDENIRSGFVEFNKFICPFKDCMHTKEKECLIRNMVSNGKVLTSRYDNYVSFLRRDLK